MADTSRTGSSDQSAQHGHRVDDEMNAEVEGLVRGAPIGTRAREDLDPEAIESATVVIDPVADVTHEAVLQRSELARFLRPSAFPADATVLLTVAREEAATDEVLDQLERLPRGIEFPTVGAIWEALGHETEHRDAVTGAAPASTDRVSESPTIRKVALAPTPAREEAVTAPADSADEEPRPSAAATTLAIGVGLLRGALHLADQTLASLQDRLTR